MTAPRDDTNSTGERTMTTQDSPGAAADTLRRAAREIRAEAEAEALLRDGDPYYGVVHNLDGSVMTEMSRYEAHWHPAVALAVADWLDGLLADEMFEDMTADGQACGCYKPALAVARTFLGESGDSRG